MRATLDLMGIYNYDPTILDLMQIPSALDRQTLIDNLIMETAEMEILYSNADFLKSAIGSWSAKNLHVWEELYDTTQYEYNPIWNKDGTILETITRNLSFSDDHTRTDNLKTEDDYTRTDDLKNTVDSTTTNSVYGFNSSTDAPADREVVDLDGTNTGTQRNAGSTSNTGTQRNAGNNTENGTISTARTEQGNIGLTSTQELIEKQRAVVAFNVMDVIIKDFMQRFCIGVY
jgi:hypothetical protein